MEPFFTHFPEIGLFEISDVKRFFLHEGHYMYALRAQRGGPTPDHSVRFHPLTSFSSAQKPWWGPSCRRPRGCRGSGTPSYFLGRGPAPRALCLCLPHGNSASKLVFIDWIPKLLVNRGRFHLTLWPPYCVVSFKADHTVVRAAF